MAEGLYLQNKPQPMAHTLYRLFMGGKRQNHDEPRAPYATETKILEFLGND